MNIWKKNDWETFSGTWFIASNKISDEEIMAMIIKNPKKYGEMTDWHKQVNGL